MSISHNLRHRRAVAAALRRSPEPNPQLGFSPTFSTPGSTPTPRPDQSTRPRPGDDDTTTVSNDDLPTGRPTTTRGTTSATGTDTSASDTTATSAATTQRLTTILPPNATAAPTTTAARITTSSARTTASSLTTDVAPPPTTTTETQDDPGMSTGAIVGGIGAGIVAIAVLGFGAAWLVRRARKRKDAAFDPTEFRKSAMLINEPTHQDTVDRGFNPAPNMSEGRGGASFGGPPGPPSPYGAGGYPGDNRAGFGSYGPGQGQPQYGAPSPMSPHSASPMFAPNPYVQHPYSPAGHSQSPFSPVDQHSPMAEYYQGPYQQQHPYAQPNTPAPGGAYPVLTRQGSNGSQQSQNQGMQRGPIPNDDYVDLNRSSVSPFQAAQYAEISRRLNPNDGHADAELPPLPKPNPFSDPSLPPTPVEASFATDNRQEKEDSPEPRPSGDSLNNIVEAGIPDFPAPPSPAHTTSSRYRVDSSPPLLPEINVHARVSYNAQNFDAAAQGGAMSPVSTAGFTAPASTMPAKPSPLASSFGATTPHAQKTEFAEPAAPADAKKGRQSMYDADDAYGGF